MASSLRTVIHFRTRFAARLVARLRQHPSRLRLPLFMVRGIIASRLPHVRRLFVSAGVYSRGSRTLERNSSAESFCAPTSGAKDIDICNTALRSNARPVKRMGRGPTKRTITTVDPKRLDPESFVDISEIADTTWYIRSPDMDHASGESSFEISFHHIYAGVDHHGDSRRRRHRQKLPAGTRGFLYYHASPKGPSHSQLRFRVTDNSDPASFSSGHDLAYDKGYLWYLPLTAIASQPLKDPLLHLLIRDGLIDAKIVSDLRNANVPPKRLKRYISSLSEPFVIEFGMYLHRIAVYSSGEKHLIPLVLPHFAYKLVGSPLVRPYDEGSALCRFERSTLPENAGRRAVVLRLLKMLVPPKRISELPREYDMPLPAEGELFGDIKRGSVWCRDLAKDTLMGRILRGLYDADEQDAGSQLGQ